jgi:signal transduction histidine kinase
MYARRLPGRAPHLAPVATAIDEMARSTMQEVRLLVGVLRDSRPGDGAKDERPLSSQIIDLTSRLPSRAMSVQFDGVEQEHLIPPQVRTTMLRIVQEGLTNAVKHQQDGRVQVTVHFDDEVVISVVSKPAETAAGHISETGTAGAGYGLIGLHERVAAHGGAFESGVAADGGFLIRARLPLPVLHSQLDDEELECASSAS